MSEKQHLSTKMGLGAPTRTESRVAKVLGVLLLAMLGYCVARGL